MKMTRFFTKLMALCAVFVLGGLFNLARANEADTPTEPTDDTVRVLCIGNSFTVDAVEDYLSPILRSVGKKVILGYPYKVGCSKQTSKTYTFFAYSFTSFDNQIRRKVYISPFFDMAMSTCFQSFFEIEINSSGFISKMKT